MTLQPSDAPDWITVPGAYRYLGTIHMQGPASFNSSLDYAAASYDGGIVVLTTIQSPLAVTGVSIDNICVSPLVFMDTQVFSTIDITRRAPFVSFISAAIGPTWRVTAHASISDASTADFYLFAAPTFPIAYAMTDNHPIIVQGISGGDPVAVGPLSGTGRDDTDGQAAVATGESVVVARNYLASVPSWARQRDAAALAATANAGTGIAAALPVVYNGTNFDVLREISGGVDNLAVAGYQGVALLGIDPATGGMNRIRAPVAGDISGAMRIVPQNSVQRVGIAGAPNAITTLTLPAGGAALYHFITFLRITRIATAALAGAAILVVTSTNLTGQQWRCGNAMIAGGTDDLINLAFGLAMRSQVANTATTIVAPAAGAAVSWDIQAEYYLGP